MRHRSTVEGEEAGTHNSEEEGHILVVVEEGEEHIPFEEEDWAVDTLLEVGLWEERTELPVEEDNGPAPSEADIHLDCTVEQQAESHTQHAGEEVDRVEEDTAHTAAVQLVVVRHKAVVEEDIPAEEEGAPHTVPAAVPVEDILAEDLDNTTSLLTKQASSKGRIGFLRGGQNVNWHVLAFRVAEAKSGGPTLRWEDC